MTTNIVPSNFVRFDSEGLELVVNTATGKAYASISATARMLEISKSTVSEAFGNHQTTDTEIQTATGLKTVRLASASVVFKLALKYHPRLAEKMGDAGANVYMLGLAGYKVAIEPELSIEDKMTLMAENFLKIRNEKLALIAQIDADRPATELGKAIAKCENNIRIGDFAKVIGMGQHKYFTELRECKIIMATSTLPYQRFLNDGYFVVTETIVNSKTYPVSLITPKGQAYLVKRHQNYIKLIEVNDRAELALDSALV